MDWFSWLSKSSLDPSLIYEYGLRFARNELQKEDLTYFNHEFLQSMGISVAKHRLEILKLARKEVGGAPNALSRLILTINNAKKKIGKRINKWVFHEVGSTMALPEPPPPARYQEQWKGALTRKYKSEKEFQAEKQKPIKTMRIAKSGPLPLVQDKLIVTNRSLKLSGPLACNMQERLLFTYRSPISSGPLDGQMYANKSHNLSGPMDRRFPSPRIYADYRSTKENLGGGYEDHSLWAALFRDLKPT